MIPPFFGPEAWGPLAAAWKAYFDGKTEAVLRIHADDGESEAMPVSLFFRDEGELREADREALARVRGRVLDGGAGVGSLSLLLQEWGAAVTALEVIPEGVRIMRERGVREVREGRLEELVDGDPFDTILLLMNGTALAGTVQGLPGFLATLARLLAPGGQVLVDSTDLVDSADPVAGAGWEGQSLDDRTFVEGDDVYPGELQYQMEFEGVRGAPFPQLFLDPRTLRRVAEENGWGTEVVWEGKGGEYLARLTRPQSG
jgi:SAM-dependent methyltransferase